MRKNVSITVPKTKIKKDFNSDFRELNYAAGNIIAIKFGIYSSSECNIDNVRTHIDEVSEGYYEIPKDISLMIKQSKVSRNCAVFDKLLTEIQKIYK